MEAWPDCNKMLKSSVLTRRCHPNLGIYMPIATTKATHTTQVSHTDMSVQAMALITGQQRDIDAIRSNRLIDSPRISVWYDSVGGYYSCDTSQTGSCTPPSLIVWALRQCYHPERRLVSALVMRSDIAQLSGRRLSASGCKDCAIRIDIKHYQSDRSVKHDHGNRQRLDQREAVVLTDLVNCRASVVDMADALLTLSNGLYPSADMG